VQLEHRGRDPPRRERPRQVLDADRVVDAVGRDGERVISAQLVPRSVPRRSFASCLASRIGGRGRRVTTTIREGKVSLVNATRRFRSSVTVRPPAATSPRPARSAGMISS
jgi:hypothetical protein